MGWELIEDTLAPMRRWHCRLTAAAPNSGPQSLALIDGATVQVEGTFGAGEVVLSGSNSGARYVPFEALRHDDITPVLPVYWLEVRVDGADETTDVVVTVAGRP